MGLRTWSKSNLEYGRKVLDSGLEGAHTGREAFLNGRPLTPFLHESVSSAWKPAVLGACVGALAGYPGNRHKSTNRMFAFGILGATFGFVAGVAWGSRDFTASVARGALRNMEKVRDAHWLENHPIDYA
jgi:hypothetical protein